MSSLLLQLVLVVLLLLSAPSFALSAEFEKLDYAWVNGGPVPHMRTLNKSFADINKIVLGKCASSIVPKNDGGHVPSKVCFAQMMNSGVHYIVTDDWVWQILAVNRGQPNLSEVGEIKNGQLNMYPSNDSTMPDSYFSRIAGDEIDFASDNHYWFFTAKNFQ